MGIWGGVELDELTLFLVKSLGQNEAALVEYRCPKCDKLILEEFTEKDLMGIINHVCGKCKRDIKGLLILEDVASKGFMKEIFKSTLKIQDPVVMEAMITAFETFKPLILFNPLYDDLRNSFLRSRDGLDVRKNESFQRP